jgi:hypothetical protein
MGNEGRLAGAMMRRCLPRRWTDRTSGRVCGDEASSDGSNEIGPRLAETPSYELRERLEVALHELQDQGVAVEERWSDSPGGDGLSAQAAALLTEWAAALRAASLGMERALMDVKLGENRSSAGPHSASSPHPRDDHGVRARR